MQNTKLVTTFSFATSVANSSSCYLHSKLQNISRHEDTRGRRGNYPCIINLGIIMEVSA
jgi:hypothetical protein